MSKGEVEVDMDLNIKIEIAAFNEQTKTVAERALKEAALHVLSVSNERVPIQESYLQDSGDTAVDRSEMRAYIFYDQPYAMAQHEELTWKHAPGRTAKFLELALEEEGAHVHELLAQQLKELFT